jgi:hypothetical protein
MKDYRLYCLDGAGNIGLADWIQATDDENAIGKARQVRPDAHMCEIWQKDRLVAKLSAENHSQRIDG